MSRHRITITEILSDASQAPDNSSSAVVLLHETKVFEQTFSDLNLGKVIQQLNAQPRRKRKASASSSSEK